MEQPSATTIDQMITALEAAMSRDRERGQEHSLAWYIERSPGLAGLPLARILERLHPELHRSTGVDSDQLIAGYQVEHELSRDENARVLLARDAVGRSLRIRELYGFSGLEARAGAMLAAEHALARSLGEPRLVDAIEVLAAPGHLQVVEAQPTGATLGERIAELSARPEIASEDRRALLHQLADFARLVDRAHEIGIVHGRLGPAAMVLDPEGPRLRGLGFAALEGLATLGASLATLAYRAPEQLGESHIRTDRRADIWALGALANLIITGKPPIPAATEAELRREAARFVPRSPRSADAGLPALLDAVVVAALAPERQRRYGRASELADDIERALSGSTPLAQRPGLGNRFIRWMRREPGIAAGGFVVFAILGTCALVTGWFIGVADRDSAIIPLETRIAAEAEARKAEREAERQLEKDQALGRRLAEIGVTVDAYRSGCFGALDEARMLDILVAAFRDRGIDLAIRPDIDRIAGIFAGAHARSARDSRRLLAGLYRVIDLIEHLKAMDSSDASNASDGALAMIERNAIIFIERCEPDPAFRHLWRVARHGDPKALDRFDVFLDPSHWRRQSPDYLQLLASCLGRYPERADAAMMLIEEAVRYHADSRALQILQGSITLERAISRQPPEADAIKEAVLHLEIALALEPRSASGRALLAMAQALDGNYRAALQNIDEATRIESNSALAWLMRAAFFQRSPLGERAREAAERALELDPGLEAARKLLADLDHER